MPKILVIEDEMTIRENIMETLELNDYEVIGADDGTIGVKLAQEYTPDLILCDIMMGEMGGYEVLDHVRGDKAISLTPFIFLTAKADRASMRHGMEMGADDYLTKPFTTEELLTAVSSRLDRHKAINERTDENIEKTKKQLAHVIAHELRTPLTSMNMAVQLLSYQVDSIPPEELHDLIQTLSTGTNRMSRLVEQMVMFVQLQSNLLDETTVEKYGQPVEIWVLLMTCSNFARTLLSRPHGVQVIVEESADNAVVKGDQNALRHGFGELIANAIAYSPEGTQVRVVHWVADDWVWVQITDQGMGMSQADIDNALGEFNQIDRERREQQGIGLGLPLAKKLFEIHGGTLTIDSVPEQGTRVTVGLPVYMG